MKKLLVIGFLLLAISAGAQVPGTATTLGGAVYNGDSWSLRIGTASPISNHIWVAGFTEFGTSVEVSGEVVALFRPFGSAWAIGPVASIGADWSDEPGTTDPSIVTYLTNSAGAASTYSFSGRLGCWGYTKYQSTFTTSAYNPGWTGGVGIWFRM